MTEVSISPESVLEPMIRAKDKLPNERRYQDSASISLANVYGMLGDFDEMRGLLPRPESDDSLWATSAYICGRDLNKPRRKSYANFGRSNG